MAIHGDDVPVDSIFSGLKRLSKRNNQLCFVLFTARCLTRFDLFFVWACQRCAAESRLDTFREIQRQRLRRYRNIGISRRALFCQVSMSGAAGVARRLASTMRALRSLDADEAISTIPFVMSNL